MKTPSVIFLHGRPGPHPLHMKYAKSIGSKTVFVDLIFRWHDKAFSPLKRYFYWVANAIYFALFDKSEVILSEGLHFTPLLMKYLRSLFFWRPIPISIVFLDDECLYFLSIHRYGKFSQRLNTLVLNSYDKILCIGKMQEDLAVKLVDRNRTPIFVGINGVSEERFAKLSKCIYNPESNKIVFIANGPSGWRGWYKGLDLMLNSFERAFLKNNSLTLTVVGEWDAIYVSEMKTKHLQKATNNVFFVGPTKEIENYLNDASLYLHTARGEAWGITINEAMAAGVPTIVSQWTGARECVEKVTEELIVSLDPDVIADKINWFFSLEHSQKIKYSERSRLVTKSYLETNAINTFGNIFKQAIST